MNFGLWFFVMLFFLWRFSVHFGLWCLNMNGSLFFYLREFSLKFSFSFRSFDMSDSFVMLFLLWRFNVHFSLWCLNMNGSLDMLYCRNFSLVLSFGWVDGISCSHSHIGDFARLPLVMLR